MALAGEEEGEQVGEEKQRCDGLAQGGWGGAQITAIVYLREKLMDGEAAN